LTKCNCGGTYTSLAKYVKQLFLFLLFILIYNFSRQLIVALASTITKETIASTC